MPDATEVTAAEVQRQFLHRLNLRIGPETAAYVLRRLDAESASPIPVMGGNARTGGPVRILVDPSQIAAGLASQSPYRLVATDSSPR